MVILDNDSRPLEEPLARLERELIDAYIKGAGYDPVALRARDDDEARRLQADASVYASARLTEVESRWHYVHRLRGEE